MDAIYDSYAYTYTKDTNLNECFPCCRYARTPFHLSFLPQKKQALFSLQHFDSVIFLSEKRHILREMNKKHKGPQVFFIYCDRIIVKAKKSQRLRYCCFQDLLLHGKTFFSSSHLLFL